MPEDPTTGYYFTQKLYHDTYPLIDSANCHLEGRYVFITGGSRGIGAEIVLSFARAGASGIAFGSRTPPSAATLAAIEAAASANGRAVPRVLSLHMDVTQAASVEAAAARVAAEFPCVDVLVNNAGEMEDARALADADVDVWMRVLDVNVKGTFLATHYFLPLVRRSVLRTVVNVNSLASQMVTPGRSAYQVSKLAQLRLTEFVVADHGDADGVLAWAVHPGGVRTELGMRLPKERHAALTEEPRLCADTVVWLVQQRREWLAGRYVMAQWDMEELMAREEEIVKGDKLKVRIRL
ncbi:hypothetical protein TD95_003737 [Thielaviopsis punctulata]|uniref:Uncharacterized protein n=1 Tax=Thielaviopsis punctulata TaxID=72032 RepID=A0A0F4Z7Z5_9PEZI|nr:hypothetical protein TD95_003737 [Thielaviopsis punctulata]